MVVASANPSNTLHVYLRSESSHSRASKFCTCRHASGVHASTLALHIVSHLGEEWSKKKEVVGQAKEAVSPTRYLPITGVSNLLRCSVSLTWGVYEKGRRKRCGK